ncbi:MAG: hypothetical protein ACI9SP_004769 [Arenicella sp.]|jgi:hypothetical protein
MNEKLVVPLNGRDYAKNKWERLKKSPKAWYLTSKKLDKSGERITRRTLANLSADQDLIESLVDARYSDNDLDGNAHFTSVLGVLMDSLRDDLNAYTEGAYEEQFDRTGLAIIELGGVHAATTNVDDFLSPLDGYAIFIEIGTYYAIQLLAKALILENFKADYIKYKEDSSWLIDLARDLYIEKDMEATREVYFHNLPEEVEAEASAVQSSVTIKVMQFIALHEFGHIVNEDRGVMSFNTIHVQHKSSNEAAEYSFEQEYNADLFAINALFSDDAPTLNKWSGFYSIFYFFAWLHSVEMKTSKPISETHPPSLDRAWRLHERLMELTHNEDHGYTVLLKDVQIKFNIKGM